MGHGRQLECNKCGYTHNYNVGGGFSFWYQYKHVYNNACNGKYGKEWKDYLNSHPYAVVDSEYSLYQCPHCHYLSSEPNLSLYESLVPVNVDKPLFSWILKKKFQLIKEFSHICPECSKKMKEIESSDSSIRWEDETIICPNCKSNNANLYKYMWD